LFFATASGRSNYQEKQIHVAEKEVPPKHRKRTQPFEMRWWYFVEVHNPELPPYRVISCWGWMFRQ